MNLRVAGIGEVRAAAIRAPDGGGVRGFGVRREIEDVRVAAGGEDDGVGGVRGDRAGDEIAGDDAFGLAVDEHDVEHLVARKHLHASECDLALQRLERAEEKLLSGLAARVEGSRDLHAAEGAILEQCRRTRARTARPARRPDR